MLGHESYTFKETMGRRNSDAVSQDPGLRELLSRDSEMRIMAVMRSAEVIDPAFGGVFITKEMTWK